jgi:6-phosphogluconate dehydrogenase
MIGLGRMGRNMAERLVRGGHEVVGFDRDPAAVGTAAQAGVTGANSLADLVARCRTPRVCWIMLPAGEPTEHTIEALAHILEPGDTVVDGGNSRYTDSRRRGHHLADRGIQFLDCGTSGGVWGLQEGYCLMVGGEADAFRRVEPLLATLAPEGGYLHTGPVGSGHYVKMIHNGIEYGMLEAYAEGFELMATHEYPLDLAAIAELWQHGSVVRSWLLDLAARALREHPGLKGILGYVEDSGEGRWTVEEAIRLGVPLPALAFSLFERFRSRQEDAWSDRFIAALRQQFGGHPVRRADAPGEGGAGPAEGIPDGEAGEGPAGD